MPHLIHELATDAIVRIWPHIDPVVILNCLWPIGLSASHIPIGSGIAYREDFYSLKLDSLQGEGLAEFLPALLIGDRLAYEKKNLPVSESAAMGYD